MIEQVVNRINLNRAYVQVCRNKGTGGVDGVQTEDLGEHFKTHGKQYLENIQNGCYEVKPILGVTIPKSNGKTRLLGIPTVVDRVFQQALHQVLQPIFEADFQQHSYGFRPNRNAHQAIDQSLKYINSGYQDIVDIELKAFFDEVEHSVLLELFY